MSGSNVKLEFLITYDIDICQEKALFPIEEVRSLLKEKIACIASSAFVDVMSDLSEENSESLEVWSFNVNESR